MPAGYAPLPTQQPARDADRELDEAFGSDDEEEHHSSETTPLSYTSAPSQAAETSKVDSAAPGTYDFERDYDYDRPPPGSPPRPSAVALPNDIGNSNGLLPASPVGTTIPRPSFFRRAVGAILPTHYQRLPTSASGSHSGIRGGGIQNDGVFSNVAAKPTRPVQVRSDDGNIYMVPEETQSHAPPVCWLLSSKKSFLNVWTVIRCCSSRCSASLLGDHHTCTIRSGYRLWNDH